MGKVVSMHDAFDPKLIRANAYDKYTAGDYAGAAQLLEQYLGIKPADPDSLAVVRRAYLKLIKADMHLHKLQDAEAVVVNHLGMLLKAQDGRTVVMNFAVAMPNFEVAEAVIDQAFEAGEAEIDRLRLDNFTKEYQSTHAAELAASRKRVRHISIVPIYEQSAILKDDLPRIPRPEAQADVLVALGDQDLPASTRTSLVTWGRDNQLDHDCTFDLFGKSYHYNPRWAKDVFSDPTASAVIDAMRADGHSNVPEDMVLVMVGLLYPVAGQIIQDPPAFAKALAGEPNSKYAKLIAWMQDELSKLSF